MKHVTATLVLTLLGYGFTFGQSSFILQSFQDDIAQATLINPAFIPNKKVYVGLPILSQNRFRLSNAFSIDDVVTRDQDDSLYVDPDRLLERLRTRNRGNFGLNTSLAYVGVRIDEGFLSVQAEVTNDLKFTYPDEIIGLLLKGNGHPDLIGKKLQLGNIDFNGTSYYQIGVGYAQRFLGNRLQVGLRVNYLKGILNMEIDQSTSGYFRDRKSVV